MYIYIYIYKERESLREKSDLRANIGLRKRTNEWKKNGGLLAPVLNENRTERGEALSIPRPKRSSRPPDFECEGRANAKTLEGP